MATMIVDVIENNAVEISADSKKLFSVIKKEATDYRNKTGTAEF